jgi:hypothetical protein
MKCPKCGYTSFPYLEKCRKCGHGLTEQRVAMGIYALRPDPPDLLLAYQAAGTEAIGGALTHPVSAPGIALGSLAGLDMEVADEEPPSTGTHERQEPANAMPDLRPTLDREAIGEEDRPPMEASAEQPSSQDMTMPQSLELSSLGDSNPEIDDTLDLDGESPRRAQTPSESAPAKPVYDLDLDTDLGALTLGGVADETGTGEDDEATDYTLEIEEDLTFEVDELELDLNDEVADEDDDEH